ncbi:MAG: acetyl esterase, partial [Myxococcota bacterium]
MLSLSERLGRDPLPLGDPVQARDKMRLSCETSAGPPPSVARVEALTLPGGLQARLYHPAEDRRPLLVFFHGGGWVVGDLDTHDTLCRRICAEVGWAVLAVDYRLAPEHPFPAALDDALTAWRFAVTAATGWAVDGERIAVGGDSAGGNLAASLCLSLRDAGERLPWQQVLIYPSVDLTGAQPS